MLLEKTKKFAMKTLSNR